MKLLVGLGNPGPLYVKTRHNMGFMTIDLFASKHNISFKEEKKLKCLLGVTNINGEKVFLCKPLTYMNLSGEAVSAVLNYYKIPLADMIIVADDLDSNPGRVRLRANGSSGGHNGLKSIIAHIGTEQFNRIKIGIGRDKNIPVADYVLGVVKEEDEALTKEAINSAADALDEFVNGITFLKISSKYSKK